MKKILTLALLLLAINFLAVAGGLAFLVGTGRLDKDKAGEIAKVLFPPPASQPTSQPTTKPVAAAPKPLMKLEELLARQAGRPATEQVEFFRSAFDEQYAQLDRRMREMEDLQRQIEAARDQLARDRAEVELREKALETRATEASRQEQDKGFQAELQLYTSMPASQVKKVFLGMEDDRVARYLQAMQPRQASKILKEFKTPEETARIQAIMDHIRKAPNAAGPGGDAQSDSRAPGGAQGVPGGAPGNNNPQPSGADRPGSVPPNEVPTATR